MIGREIETLKLPITSELVLREHRKAAEVLDFPRLRGLDSMIRAVAKHRIPEASTTREDLGAFATALRPLMGNNSTLATGRCVQDHLPTHEVSIRSIMQTCCHNSYCIHCNKRLMAYTSNFHPEAVLTVPLLPPSPSLSACRIQNVIRSFRVSTNKSLTGLKLRKSSSTIVCRGRLHHAL